MIGIIVKLAYPQSLFFVLLAWLSVHASAQEAPLGECPRARIEASARVVVDGERVRFRVTLPGTSLDPRLLEYNWSITSGTIIHGQGTSEIIVSTHGVSGEGSLTATFDVTQYPHCEWIWSETVVVRSEADGSPGAAATPTGGDSTIPPGLANNTESCPMISITGPPGPRMPEQEKTYTATIGSEGHLPPLKYVWSLTTGRIVSGDGTKEIVVVQEKGDQNNLTVTLEIEGLPPACPSIASESVAVVIDTSPVLFDQYRTLSRAQEKLRIRKFLDALIREDHATAVIIAGTGGRDQIKSTEKRLKAIYRYWHSMAAGRSVSVSLRIVLDPAGSGGTQFYLIPAGAGDPQCSRQCTWLTAADLR